jgi:DNA-directed RNA polymerase specialized sigma24 family protein
MNGVSKVTLDQLIHSALTGQPYNHERLGREARAYARKLSAAYGKDLAEDLHEEVFTQAFVELLEAGADALAERPGKSLFRDAVLSAIRVVRASYAPPGQRTRPTAKAARARVAAEDIGRITDAPTIERCTVGDGPERSLDFDRLESFSAAAEFRRADDRLEAEAILATAPETVRAALHLIHIDNEPVGEVAARFGLSRFALDRRIDSFCAAWRAAA